MNERVILLDNLIKMIRQDNTKLNLIVAELEYLRFKDDTTKEELKSKLLELLELAKKIHIVENICVNGLVKL